MLIRLDERSAMMSEDFTKLTIALEADGDRYVTKSDFKPVKLIVYGMSSVALLGVVTALVNLVIKT